MLHEACKLDRRIGICRAPLQYEVAIPSRHVLAHLQQARAECFQWIDQVSIIPDPSDPCIGSMHLHSASYEFSLRCAQARFLWLRWRWLGFVMAGCAYRPEGIASSASSRATGLHTVRPCVSSSGNTCSLTLAPWHLRGSDARFGWWCLLSKSFVSRLGHLLGYVLLCSPHRARVILGIEQQLLSDSYLLVLQISPLFWVGMPSHAFGSRI